MNENRNSKRWIVLVVLFLILILLLVFCSRSVSFFREEIALSRAAITASAERIPEIADQTPTASAPASMEPSPNASDDSGILVPACETLDTPVGEITILSPTDGQTIQADASLMGNQAGNPGWFLGPVATWATIEEHLLIWEEYPGADEYFVFSGIPVENGELGCGYSFTSGTNPNAYCENGQCTAWLGLCRPDCSENGSQVVTVIACHCGCQNGQAIGVGQVTVVTTWDSGEQYKKPLQERCERRDCGSCPTEVDQTALERYGITK